MNRVRVLVCDGLHPDGVARFKEHPEFELLMESPGSLEELKEKLSAVDAVLVRSATKITAVSLQRANRLRMIGRAGIGVDTIDVEAASAKGILVINTPDENAITTAEHAIALLFSAARLVPQATDSVKAGRWEKKSFVGVELFEKTAGIVGFGRIGRIVADRLQAFHMRVVSVDPMVSEATMKERGVRRVSLEELLSESDVIMIHAPLTSETRDLFSRNTLRRMKRGSILVNCARGGIVDEVALTELLREGHLFSAAFDVFAQEPTSAENPLLHESRLIATPHIGAQTSDAQRKVSIAIADATIDFFTRGVVRNGVNLSAIQSTA